MSSSPGMDTPSFTGQTPTDQPPLMSNSPAISYTGSYGQPSNNFQGMGKSPQVAPPMQQQAPQMQSPMQMPMQPQQDPQARLQDYMSQLRGSAERNDGAVMPWDMRYRG